MSQQNFKRREVDQLAERKTIVLPGGRRLRIGGYYLKKKEEGRRISNILKVVGQVNGDFQFELFNPVKGTIEQRRLAQALLGQISDYMSVIRERDIGKPITKAKVDAMKVSHRAKLERF